jgi:hypothetical protein
MPGRRGPYDRDCNRAPHERIFHSGARAPFVSTPKSQTSMTWEYKTLFLNTTGFLGGKLDQAAFDKELASFGRDGWELVSIFDTNSYEGATRLVVAVFKRPARR